MYLFFFLPTMVNGPSIPDAQNPHKFHKKTPKNKHRVIGQEGEFPGNSTESVKFQRRNVMYSRVREGGQKHY